MFFRCDYKTDLKNRCGLILLEQRKISMFLAVESNKDRYVHLVSASVVHVYLRVAS